MQENKVKWKWESESLYGNSERCFNTEEEALIFIEKLKKADYKKLHEVEFIQTIKKRFV